MDETLNKTDANDADGLAQLAEAGFYKACGSSRSTPC
jgi:error-prone DNA polymerase